MRKVILALAVTFVAPTAIIASPAIGVSELGVPTSAVQEGQMPPGLIGSDHGDLGGKVILARGDKSGTGPGAGGHKGQKKGGEHGKQKKDKKD